MTRTSRSGRPVLSNTAQARALQTLEDPVGKAAAVDELLSETIEALERGGPYTYRDEADLQLALSDALSGCGIDHQLEARIGDRDRIDLLTTAGVGIEVKVAGSSSAVTRQLTRYAHHSTISALVLVTTRASHLQMPSQLADVPVRVVTLLQQGLL